MSLAAVAAGLAGWPRQPARTGLPWLRDREGRDPGGRAAALTSSRPPPGCPARADQPRAVTAPLTTVTKAVGRIVKITRTSASGIG